MESTELALFSAILSDPEHKERLAALRAEMKAIEDAREEVRVATEKANETLATARAEREAAAAMLAEVEAAKAKHADDTAILGKTIDSLNAEKVAWEAVRQKVDADQAEREKALKAGERKLAEAQRGMEDWRSALSNRDAALKASEAAHGRRAAAIQKALEVT